MRNAINALCVVLFLPIFGWMIVIGAAVIAGAADEVKKNFQKERHTA